MNSILSKIILLGGWFYISLVLVFIFLLTSAKKDKFNTIVLIIASVFAIYYSLIGFLNNVEKLKLFFNSDKEKIASTTFNQYSFAKVIQGALTNSSRNCLLWSWDIPTKYLVQESYPIHLEVISDSEQAVKKCDFIVSQFTSRPELKKNPIIIYKSNYIYNLKTEE